MTAPTTRGHLDGRNGRPATVYTPPECLVPCPTCMGPSRETVGMVCQTCRTDYGTADSSTDQAAAAELAAVLEPHFYEAYRLGKYSPEGYLPPWHDTDRRAQAWPEAMRGVEELLASDWLATQLAAAVHTALTEQRAALLAAAQRGNGRVRLSAVLQWMDWHIENPQAREAVEL